jgi:DNA-binding transcriptional regulator YhcF (GntR family)
MQPIRTISQIPMKVKITLNENVPLYEKLASKIEELKTLGMQNSDIATKLQINRKTFRKALQYQK